MAAKSSTSAKKPKSQTAKVAKTATPKAAASVAQRATLRTWNIWLAVLLAAQAIAIVVLSGAQTIPVTLQYLTTDTLASAIAGHDVLAVASRHLFDVQVSWVVAKFLLIFALFYALSATLLRARYEAWLDRGVNALRWVGAGLGTGVMAVSVAAISGISDLGYLVLILASLVILGSLSVIVEFLGVGRRLRKFAIITALITATLPVLAIGLTLYGVQMYGGSLPTFAYYIYGSMFLGAGAYAAACILRLRQVGKWADAMYAEKMFMLLGFAVSSILAWQIFAGVLQP